MASLSQKIHGGKPASTAKVVDGVLILSLLDAVTPVVWRWNLSDAKASALEIREKDGTFNLILKTPRADVQDVAPFDTREKALYALSCVSKALESAHGQMQERGAVLHTMSPAPTPTAPAVKHNDGTKLLTGLLAIAVLIGLFIWLGNLAPRRLDDSISATASSSPSTQGEGDTGVPISAEEYLNGL